MGFDCRVSEKKFNLLWGNQHRLQCVTWLVKRTLNNEQQNIDSNPKTANAAAGYQGSVKIELLRGTRLLLVVTR